MKFFSVIIPTYNRAHVIKRAIDSVSSQSFKNFELIVVDDGSTDETQKILEQYPQIKNIKTKNQGVSAARNVGVKKSQGQWIAFLDSDDEWLENKLQKQYEFIQNNPDIEIVHTEEIWIRNGKQVNPKKIHQKFGGSIFERCTELCLISPSAVVIKRNLFENQGGFREDFPACEDYDLWLKITCHNEVGFINEFLLKKYGGHEDQLSQKYKAMDFWRVKSLKWVLDNKKLNESQRQKAQSVLLRKSQILLQGYEKHQNYGDDFHYIQSLFK